VDFSTRWLIVCRWVGRQPTQLQGGGMGVGVAGLDSPGGDEVAQVGLDGVGVEPCASGVVASGILELVGPGGLPLDVAVEEGNAHGDGGADGELLAQPADQSTGQVGHGAR